MPWKFTWKRTWNYWNDFYCCDLKQEPINFYTTTCCFWHIITSHYTYCQKVLCYTTTTKTTIIIPYNGYYGSCHEWNHVQDVNRYCSCCLLPTALSLLYRYTHTRRVKTGLLLQCGVELLLWLVSTTTTITVIKLMTMRYILGDHHINPRRELRANSKFVNVMPSGKEGPLQSVPRVQLPFATLLLL